MNLDARLSQLVRDALEPMLADRLDLLEERLGERLEALVRSTQAPASAPQLLTQKEVASYLGVSPKTIQRRVAAGTFPPGIAISSHPRWRQSDVDAWLEGQRGT